MAQQRCRVTDRFEIAGWFATRLYTLNEVLNMRCFIGVANFARNDLPAFIESGRFLIAHRTQYSPVLEAVRSISDHGEIGEILEMRARGKEDRRGRGEDL